MNVNTVVGVPVVGLTVPLVITIVPHVAARPSTGPTNRNRDAVSQAVSETAPITPVRMRGR